MYYADATMLGQPNRHLSRPGATCGDDATSSNRQPIINRQFETSGHRNGSAKTCHPELRKPAAGLAAWPNAQPAASGGSRPRADHRNACRTVAVFPGAPSSSRPKRRRSRSRRMARVGGHGEAGGAPAVRTRARADEKAQVGARATGPAQPPRLGSAGRAGSQPGENAHRALLAQASDKAQDNAPKTAKSLNQHLFQGFRVTIVTIGMTRTRCAPRHPLRRGNGICPLPPGLLIGTCSVHPGACCASS